MCSMRTDKMDKTKYLDEYEELKPITNQLQRDTLLRERKALFDKMVKMIKQNPESSNLYVKWFNKQVWKIDKLILELK